MKQYGYYPGCSLERNAGAYQKSTMAIAPDLGLTFNEIDDWNCCGATEYIALEKLPAYALVGRNLALAAEQAQNGHQLVAPCSACFLNLRKTDYYLRKTPGMAEKVNDALGAGGLHYEPGSITVRHLLEIVVEDVGYEAVAEKVQAPLTGLRIAPYYGCLIVRPTFNGQFDDAEYPPALRARRQRKGSYGECGEPDVDRDPKSPFVMPGPSIGNSCDQGHAGSLTEAL